MSYPWLLLHYKLPSEPSARRVYIWRKLKRLGALLLHDVVWVLPNTPRTREQFQWLAGEIAELGGQAILWESQLVLGEPEEALVQAFVAQVEATYQEILKALNKKTPDLVTLSQQYQQTKQKDYFQSKLGDRVREALTSARGGKGT